MTLHLLQFSHLPILPQLQLEEALLRADQRNWCLINYGSPPAIVLGISGKPEELINEEKWKIKPVPIIRRFSGGGTVFIDENTCFVTFICNASFIPISPFPNSIMRWTEELYRPLFASHPFSLKENDYTLNSQKFGGNAQSITKNRWLHHSSLLWDFSSLNMEYLKMPKKMPAYRQHRSHVDFLCNLRDFWPHPTTFQTALIDHLLSQFDVQKIEGKDIKDVLQLPHRKATVQLSLN
jgi:lipoate-protein ligase A